MKILTFKMNKGNDFVNKRSHLKILSHLSFVVFSIRLAGTTTAVVEDFLGACASTFILV
ncbi:hypothetical protein HanIR_Chr10g0469311 [Helianthus annuus]|nr:hypothetical protein HanIR_Chr10g0469311 [Helianthus annuus]